MSGHNFTSHFTIEDLASDAQRAMYVYWLAARGSASMAPKSSLDPVKLPRQSLSSLAVVEPVDGNDFRVRIIGSAVRSAAGWDATGHMISQIEGAEDALERFRRCLSSGSTYYTSGPTTWANRRQKFYTSLILPFGIPGNIERIVVVFKFTHHSPERPSTSHIQALL